MALAILFLVQLGLAPFDFSASSLQTVPRIFFTASRSVTTLGDVIGNIALYVPIGVLGSLALSRRRCFARFAWPITVVTIAGLSGAIEWIQSYSPSRVSSLIDWIANGLGGAVGVAFSRAVRGILRSFKAAAVEEASKFLASSAAKGYLAVLLLGSALPFSFAFDLERLKLRVDDADWAPMAGHGPNSRRVTAEDSGAEPPAAVVQWQRMSVQGRGAAVFVSFAVLSWLLFAWFGVETRLGGLSSILLIGWTGAGFAVLLSLVELAKLAPRFHFSDLLCRLMGLGAGVVTIPFVFRDFGRWMAGAAQRIGIECQVDALKRLYGRLARFGLAATALYIVYCGLIPFRFDRSPSEWPSIVRLGSFLPFTSYAFARLPQAMDDASTKMALNVLLAGLILAVFPALRGLPRRWHYAIPASVGLLFSSLFEVAQFGMSARVPSLTDPMLALFGCLMGVWTWERIGRIVHWADGAAIPAARPWVETEVAPGLSVADAALAGLSDPHPESPEEPEYSLQTHPKKMHFK